MWIPPHACPGATFRWSDSASVRGGFSPPPPPKTTPRIAACVSWETTKMQEPEWCRMTDCGTITVRAEFSRSKVEVTQCAGMPSVGNAGETVSVDLTIRNGNTVDGEAVAVIETPSGERLGETERLTLPSSDLTTKTVDFQLPNNPGADIEPEAKLVGVEEAGAARGLSVGSGRTRR